MVFDLQHARRLVWVSKTALYIITVSSPRPIVRPVLASGRSLDLTEPSKARRATVSLAAQPRDGLARDLLETCDVYKWPSSSYSESRR